MRTYKTRNRVAGERISKEAKESLINVYNNIIDAILGMNNTKRKGGILNIKSLDEPMKNLYRAKEQIWKISQGLNKPNKAEQEVSLWSKPPSQ